jgi:hypothetical protein
MKTALALFAVAAVAATASAGIGVETYGAAAPPVFTGSFLMKNVPFRTDIFTDTTTTPDATLGTITFSSPVSVRQIGFGWATWSHGYTGNCFYTNGVTTLTMTLDSGIQAFRFYAEPNPFGVFSITATGSDGFTTISATQAAEGSAGAAGWGFYGTGGSVIRSVTVSSDIDFAVGEFATPYPAPGSLSALALAALGAARRRR